MKRNIFLALLLLAGACKKDDNTAPANNDQNNRLLYVIEDNLFNFSYFNTALTVTNMNTTLLGEGPYTVLVPDNSAFNNAGYNSETSVATASGITLNNMVRYHVLDGRWELNKLPFRFNQSIITKSGAQLFVTHWVKNQDTVLTINGTRVTAQNMPASNGLIQVINTVMPPLLQNMLGEAVAADPSLTYLNVALQQAGMKDLLAGEGPYTIFAPNNNAFIAAGFPTLDSISRTDPAVLKAMLQFHIVANRRFVYDYVLSTDNTNVSQQTMLNNSTTTVKLISSGVDYSGITIQGAGNTQPCNLVKSNVLTNNGVLHVIDKVLKENF
jgi:uncharacterized surface protein with fasciclin (FAS1) repeats